MLRAIVAYLREVIAVEDADKRIEGSGEVILDPAYNSRYEGERDLQRLSKVDDQEQESEID